MKKNSSLFTVRFQKTLQLYQKLHWTVFFRIFLLNAFSKLFFKDAKYFFSQEGEDIKILYFLRKFDNGFYVDIGSNQPIVNSNTFKLYLQGWTGILVDGNRALIEKSKKLRKKDICINALVSNVNEKVKFYIAANDLMSSMDADFAALSTQTRTVPVEVEMETITINQILEQHLPPGKNVDVLSIDVEGHDFEVLQSIDLLKYRPSLIIIEDLTHSQTPIGTNLFNNYLAGFNYQLLGRDFLNLYFIPE